MCALFGLSAVLFGISTPFAFANRPLFTTIEEAKSPRKLLPDNLEIN